MKQFPSPTLTAFVSSASSSTMFADFPPSSRATRLIVPAATSCTRRPAATDPVNDTMSTPGCAASASPASGPTPWTTLNTPAGSPASAVIVASAPAVSGATSEGLSTTVHPATRAGASLATTWCSG